MKIFSLFNMSGGVGKSTLTMNLAFHLQQELGLKTLVIDMDPQASLTTFMGLDPFESRTSLLESLIQGVPLSIVHSPGLWCDLVPANIYLSQAELQLSALMRREYRLSEAVSRTVGYDVVLIDCPPSLGMLSINCLVATDFLIIPAQTEYKSIEATTNLLQVTLDLSRQANGTLQVFGAIPTLYDERTNQARRALEAITLLFEQMKDSAQFGGCFQGSQVFKPIPRRVDFSNAQEQHLPLALYAPHHTALEPLREVSQGIAAQAKGMKVH